MLRVETKNSIRKIMRDISMLCEASFSKDEDSLCLVLQECLEAIFSIKKYLEKEGSIKEETILIFEKLYEIFSVPCKKLINKDEKIALIKDLLEKSITLIDNLDAKYLVVFFPYKADMWDSLESIWMACKEDVRCECVVVPIPYYHYDAEKNEWLYRYEIDRFPSYVPVAYYQEYDLEAGVDVAFVHNPYDEYNHVTHVHSDYYSYNLKKVSKILFYVPYYVTAGNISKNHSMLSVYRSADYLIVQSESFKEGLKKYNYYEKALVMGSPKLDRVIRLNRNKKIIPYEWKERLRDKKSLMLNTSLNRFLRDSEAYLQKLAYLFDVISQRDDVVIVWRPHPLLLSTIESMRPHLLDTYISLQKFFLENNIGILDTTSDVTTTVAIVDGYIGESASSVVNLFSAITKPLFVLNNYFFEDASNEEKQRLLISDCQKIGDRIYCAAVESGNIFEVYKSDWENSKKVAKIESIAQWIQTARESVRVGDDIYYTPLWSQEFYVYNVKENKTKIISSMNRNHVLNYRFCFAYKNKIMYIAYIANHIMEYDIETGSWQKYDVPIEVLQNNVNEYVGEKVFGCFANNNFIWITTVCSNRVLCFDVETRNYQVYEIGDEIKRYSAITVVNNTIYLSDAQTGHILVWDIDKKRLKNNYFMPSTFVIKEKLQGLSYAHSRILVVGDSLFTIPGTSNGVVKVNLKSGECEIIAKEFWDDVFEQMNGYKYEMHGTITFAKMIDDNTLLVQKRRDASLLEYNVKTGEYIIHNPKLAPYELEKLLDGEDGFEKLYSNGEFSRRESKYFSLNGFLNDLVNERLDDAMARQKAELKTMAVNLDGSCGEKVHDFMMKVLEKQS